MSNVNPAIAVFLFSATLLGCAPLREIVTAKPVVAECPRTRPPAPPSEPVPTLEADQVWVPGYYEPVAGAWVWHGGRAVARRDGYCVMPASYAEVDGRISFRPPVWHRQASTPANASQSTTALALGR